MKKYPLVFAFRDLIAGNGFVVSVEIDGRALLVEEDDGDTWLFGVQPGTVAGGDPQRSLAFAAFKKNYLTVLFDIAADTTSFEEFERDVKKFLISVNEPNDHDWNEALADVRSKQVSLPNLVSVKAEDRPPGFAIVLLDKAKTKSTANEFDNFAFAEAA